MVPVKLKLRNFMAYRETSLDFTGIHLAVLTGENGAGKSSLLDAITWALWGKARARRDDELIHLGQTEMEVEYSFDLGGDVYRIIRKRDASKRGRSDLAFHVEEAGGWRTLTETSLRLTQRKINTLMRLDYDTFINSAFLLQGRADEFTTKTAGQRKEILSDILGLGIYDVYGDRAKKHAVEKEKEGAGLTAKVEQIEQELAKESQYRAELAEAQQNSAELGRELQLADKEMDRLREKHRAINDKQRQLDDLRRRLEQTEADIKETAENVVAAEKSITHYEGILARRDEIEAGLAALTKARGTVKDWDERLQASLKLSQRKHELDTALNQARAEVEANLREIKAQVDLLTPKATNIEDQREQLLAAEATLAELQTLSETKEKKQSALGDSKEENARLTEQNKSLVAEMNDIKTKLTQLQEAGSDCPICRRPLDDEHQAEVLAQFQEEGKAKGDLYRDNQIRGQEIADQQKQLQQEIKAADKSLRDLAPTQRKVAQLSQSLVEAEQAAATLIETEQKRQQLQQQLDDKSYATEVIAALDEVKAELAELGYDEAAHNQAKDEVEAQGHFEEEGRTLAEAEVRISEAKTRLEKEQARHTRLLEQTAADRERVAELEKDTAELAELSRQLNEASATVDRLQREDRFARDKVAMVNQQLNHISYLGKQRGELEEQLQQIREVQGIYRELQVAFGKKGVQALLIESAIPEIEDEANRLLTRMTEGRMHLRFETQREAKSSENTIETLDIRIADELGTRDYELYSGGEAFRVNFAIRIAMSKVLARRAGARLQTLVVDEGFGTQDGPGRERLIEAINAIQRDFEKIVIITHIEELKDAFPVQIDVWKGEDGSHVAIR